MAQQLEAGPARRWRFAAREALSRARRKNKHVAATKPRQLPNQIRWGAKDEAVASVHGAAPTVKLCRARRIDAVADRLHDLGTNRARRSAVSDLIVGRDRSVATDQGGVLVGRLYDPGSIRQSRRNP